MAIVSRSVKGGTALSIGLLLALMMGGCADGTLDENVAAVNDLATRAASGSGAAALTPGSGSISTPNPTAAPTDPPNFFDLTTDPAALLVTAWGQIYGLTAGQEFTIIATGRQVSAYIISTLQQGGFDEVVRGGSVTMGAGQLRVDLSLIDEEGTAGAGTASFQPTLDEVRRLRLNPQGADFSGLDLPGDLPPAIGDAVHSALTGAPNDPLSRVALTEIAIEADRLRVEGVVR